MQKIYDSNRNHVSTTAPYFQVGGYFRAAYGFAAVIFGIYGPKIADRLTMLGGVPLGDVVEAVTHLRLKAIFQFQGQKHESPLNPNDQNATLSRLLGRTYHLPNLADAGYQLQQVLPASLPGASFRAAELIYESISPNNKNGWCCI